MLLLMLMTSLAADATRARDSAYAVVQRYEERVRGTTDPQLREQAIAAADRFLSLEPRSPAAVEVALFAVQQALRLDARPRAEARLAQIVRQWPGEQYPKALLT